MKIAINGFGRIGRPVLKRILEKHKNIEVAAINDLADAKTLAHLFKYDSVYGIYNGSMEVKDDWLVVDGKKIKCLAEKEPLNLPWKEIGIDVVLECSGVFTEYEGAKKHIAAGAKKVVISAPSKSREVPHFVLGVNEEKYDALKDDVVSMASCTTNCLAPVAKVLHQALGIEYGLMTTAHSYTNDQRILDLPHKDLRRARAAGLSMIPTTTGAATTVGKIIPELNGKIDGVSVRIPTPAVSLVDLVAYVKKETSIKEVNDILIKATQDKKLKGILAVEEAPLVSIDFKGNSYSAIIDLPSTMVCGKNLIKVFAWYDNEWGYACRLAEFAEYINNLK